MSRRLGGDMLAQLFDRKKKLDVLARELQLATEAYVARERAEREEEERGKEQER